MPSIIETENLTKVYPGRIKAVDGVSFDVAEGEIFGFLGPNGAGKSTTIMMLTTLIRPTSGRAWIAGHDVSKEPNKVRLNLGYVSQDLAVDDALTGRENLYLQGAFYHLPQKEVIERADEVLDLVGLRERADDRVETYSGGMRKRLDIAEGLIHRPRVLFLDEPTLGLDIQTRREIWNYINRLREGSGMTIFLTTHYMDEADSLCDRIAIIDRGVIKAIGSPSSLKDQLGGDIIEIRFGSTSIEIIQKAVEAIKKLDFIENIQPLSNSHGSSWIDSRNGISRHVDANSTSYRIIARNGETTLPMIFEVALHAGAEIGSVTFKKPSLDDVFLNFTGRELRDEGGSREDAMRMRMTIRRART